MKKSRFLICACAAAVIIAFIMAARPWAKQPFRGLSVDEIAQVTVTLRPPDKTFHLTDDGVAELVQILNSIVIYKEDPSYRDYAGQAVLFKIIKKDGTVAEITAYNPFLIIDGIGYKTEYGPCQALNALGNR